MSNFDEPNSTSILRRISRAWKTITNEGQPPEARSGHTAVLYKGQMIIHGGYIDGYGDNAQFCGETFAFCFKSQRWRALPCEGTFHQKVFGHTAVVIDDDMYVFGGQDFVHVSRRLSRLSLKPNTEGRHEWTEILVQRDSYQPIPRWGHSAVLGHVESMGASGMIVFAGATLYDGPLNDLLFFEPKSQCWTLLAESKRNDPIPAMDADPAFVPKRRRRHTAVVFGERMFVFGGRSETQFFNDLLALDLRTLTWTELQPGLPLEIPLRPSHDPHLSTRPLNRTGHLACVSAEGLMYVFGGLYVRSGDPALMLMAQQDSVLLNDVWVLDLTTLEWRPVAMHRVGCEALTRNPFDSFRQPSSQHLQHPRTLPACSTPMVQDNEDDQENDIDGEESPSDPLTNMSLVSSIGGPSSAATSSPCSAGRLSASAFPDNSVGWGCSCADSPFYGVTEALAPREGFPAWRSMGVAVLFKDHLWIHGGRDKRGPFGDTYCFYAALSPPSLTKLVAEYILENSIPYRHSEPPGICG